MATQSKVSLGLPLPAFFAKENPVHPELALITLDIFMLMKLCKEGDLILLGAESYLSDAYLLADFDKVQELKGDIRIIEANHKVFKKAYQLAMN